MALRFYNTLSRKKEDFKEIHQGRVSLYTCGPTVYNKAHIGNFRTFIFEDILKRYLKFKGYKVMHVMNITDVDDKTIRDSKKANMSLLEYTQKYTKLFFEDLDFLHIERAEYYPKATEHVPEMIELMEMLEQKGFIYETDGSYYFSIGKFDRYGALSKIDVEGMKSGVRYDADEYEKEDVRDFVLWKASRSGEPSWETKYGNGRPGWHLECSAMARKYLGDTIDIHCGAVDLIFPHHENEIAQSECATGHKFVNYWLHGAFLNIKQEKMAKSKGNVFTLDHIAEQGFTPAAIRYFLFSSHYRSPLNVDDDELQMAESAVRKLNDAIANIKQYKPNDDGGKNLEAEITKARTQFMESMDDDLNTPGGLAAVFTFVKALNNAIDTNKLTTEGKAASIAFFGEINKVLGVFHLDDLQLEDVVEALIAEREEAREAKDFKRADVAREKLTAMGIILEDTPQGVRWKRRK